MGKNRSTQRPADEFDAGLSTAADQQLAGAIEGVNTRIMATTEKIAAPRVLLSVEDAAERLALSRTRLYGLIKTGEIVSIRIGRLRRVPVEALAVFTARLIAEQSPPPADTMVPPPREAGDGS